MLLRYIIADLISIIRSPLGSYNERAKTRMIAILRSCSIGLVCAALFMPLDDYAQLKETHLRKADRAKWDQILKIPGDCQKRFSITTHAVDYSGLEFDHVNSNESLVVVDCYTGAYQPGVILYLLKEHPTQTAKMLRVNGVQSETDDDGHALPYRMFSGLVHFYQKTGSLEILSKYRGLGDCGRFLRYHYENGGFTLFEFREQPECGANGGLGSTDFHHWPIKPNP